MKLNIHAQLDYQLEHPTDVLLQLEAAAIPEQRIEAAHIDISEGEHCLSSEHLAQIAA